MRWLKFREIRHTKPEKKAGESQLASSLKMRRKPDTVRKGLTARRGSAAFQFVVLPRHQFFPEALDLSSSAFALAVAVKSSTFERTLSTAAESLSFSSILPVIW